MPACQRIAVAANTRILKFIMNTDVTPLGQHLAEPTYVEDFFTLAQNWHDMRLTLTLANAAPAAQIDFGAHIRRSFLGALGPGASPAARSNRPCNWDPPCTLDVFNREQWRTAKGGMPKPFSLHIHPDGRNLCIELTVFGMACDWFHAAADAMTIGLLTILPWTKATHGRITGPPVILDRQVSLSAGLETPAQSKRMILDFPNGLDVSGREGASPVALVSAAVKRVNMVSRWQGLVVPDDIAAKLIADARRSKFDGCLDIFELITPNRFEQKRQNKIGKGAVSVSDFPKDLIAAMSIAERCQMGRGTAWGLGRFVLSL